MTQKKDQQNVLQKAKCVKKESKKCSEKVPKKYEKSIEKVLTKIRVLLKCDQHVDISDRANRSVGRDTCVAVGTHGHVG